MGPRMRINYSPLKKREGDWAELIFAKTSGIVLPDVFAKVNSAQFPSRF